MNDPQRKKSEEVILSKIGSSKENLTIIKSVLSIFILTYSFWKLIKLFSKSPKFNISNIKMII